MDFRKLLALATVALLAVACSKQALTKTSTDKETLSLVGTWQWVRSEGGLSYQVNTPLSTGNEIRLSLSSDSTYSFYTNNVLTAHGNYWITQRTCIHDGTLKPFLNFSSGSGLMLEKQPSDSLVLSDENYDGFVSVYVHKGFQ